MIKHTIPETAALKALLSETADHQMPAAMLGFVADRLMALDVDQLCGAEAHERSTGRVWRKSWKPGAMMALTVRKMTLRTPLPPI